MKLMLFSVLTLSASTAMALAASTEDQRKGKDALELFYINNKAYDPVSCKAEQHDDITYALCSHPLMDRGNGALWAILDGPTLVPVNGKAIGQFKKYGPSIESMDGTPVPAKLSKDAFGEKIPDIPAILENFK